LRADRILEQLRQGQRPSAGAANFLLRYLNVPNYVWSSPWHPVLFTGSLERHSRTYIRAYNGSLKDAKVRVQALFGGVIIQEYDVQIPAGFTRTIVPHNLQGLFTGQDKPLPNTLVFASDVKVIFDGHMRTQELATEIDDTTVSKLALVETRANLTIEQQDCTDLTDNAHACLSPVVNTDWDTLIPGGIYQ